MFVKVSTVIFFFILINSSAANTDEVQTYTCDNGPNLLWMCSLEKIKLTKDNSNFKPVSKNGTLITSVYITDSSIPILGEDICTEFPKTEHIWLNNIGVEQVQTASFKKCKNLKRVFINQNPLRQLTIDTFRYNTDLQLIDLAHNQLREVPRDLFYYNTKLEHLSLFDNLLRDFSFDTVKRCKELASINVASNDLSDLNEVTLLDNLPKLRDISYNDNELNCGRILEINRAFDDAKVTVRTVHAEKVRFYPYLEVQDIKCLSDSDWLSVYQRKSLTRK